MSMIAFILYCLFCLLVGLSGRHRRSGFVGASLLSFVLTPVAMLIVLYVTAPRRPS